MFPARLLCLVACFVVLAPAASWGQGAPERSAGLQRQELSLDGVLRGVQPGRLQVVSKDGEPWLIKVQARPEDVTYLAAADASWLRPGMFVQFQGEFDRHGRAVAPVAQLTVFTPERETRLGAFPDSPAPAAAAGFFAEADSEGKPQPKPRAETFSLTVAGRLTGLDGRRIRVAASNAVLEAELAEEAVIAVEVNNYAFARNGDQVSIGGWYLHKGQGYANRLLVRAAEPLSYAKGARRSSPSRETKDVLEALNNLSAGDAPSSTASQEEQAAPEGSASEAATAAP